MTGEPFGTTLPCQAHVRHTPASHINQHHHVWPLGDHGPDIPANRVVLCPTGHVNTHSLLDAYRKAGGDPGWQVRRRYSVKEREYAAVGWDRIKRQAM